MSSRVAIMFTEQVLGALAHMHAKKIAHTDIKPENILVESANDIKRGIKLIDFGGSVTED